MAGSSIDHLQPVRRIRRLIWGERKIIGLIFAYAIINGLIVLILPLGIQAIINYILGGRVSSSWYILIVIVIIGLIISGLIQIAQLSFTEKLQQRIFARSSFEIAARLPRIKLESLNNAYAPEVVNRFFDTVNLQKGMASLLVDYPTAILQVFFGLVLISVYHPFFLFFSLFVVLALYVLFKYTAPGGVKSSLKESTSKYEVAHWLEELARSLGTFKLAGRTSLPLLRVDQLISTYLYYRRKHFSILLLQYKFAVGFKVVTISALLIMGSLLLIDNQISLGQFVAAEIILILIMNSIEKLIIGLEKVYDTLTSAEKLGTISDLPMESDQGGKSKLSERADAYSIQAEHLTFRYPGHHNPVLDDLQVKLPSGSKSMLWGPPAAGKATLLQVISGLYEGYDGRLLYNDIPLTALKPEALRTAIGDNIWQETIFKGSLRENLSLGREGVDDEVIYRALEKCLAVDGVNALEDGLNTVMYPGGMKLSRSFIRRIMLARSIVANPKIVLLDLRELPYDMEEREIFYEHICSGPYTMLAISNERELLKRCDQVLFLDKGRLVFDGGSHSFLISDYAQSLR